jgi:disulfide bond formation protein DsbB
MQKIYELNTKRFFWLLVTIAGFGLLSTALYFQHAMAMAPCFLCINQRIAVIIIGVAGILGMINPKNAILKAFAYFLWIGGSVFGLGLAGYQAMLQMNPPEFSSCGAGMDYILANNSLIDAIPMLLQPTGNCSDVSWVFLNLTMPQWMVFIFSVSLIISLFFIIGRFVFKNKENI